MDASGAVNELYNSDTVGGDSGTTTGRRGLYEATEAMEEYFYLFTLNPGQSGYVELYVLLDGETQGNAYQQTLAKIQMQFRVLTDDVEESSHESSSPPKTPYTGDATNATPWFIAMGVSGVAILGLAIALVSRRKKEKEKENV